MKELITGVQDVNGKVRKHVAWALGTTLGIDSNASNEEILEVWHWLLPK